MKLLALILFSLSLPLTAQERDGFTNIRVTAEYIETSHQLVTRVIIELPGDSGPRLHARMRELVKEKKARILETSILTTRPGQKAGVCSMTEHIFPSEYLPPMLPTPHSTWKEQRENPPYPFMARPPHPFAFETKDVGARLEIEPLLGEDKLINLYFAQNLTRLLRYETASEYKDRWGDASIRFPIYESLKAGYSLILTDGQFGLVGLLTPTRKSGGPDTSRKILLFVRADIIPIGS